MIKEQSIIPIILLNWNGWEDTIACLSSIFNTQYEEFCVIIADNHSSDKSIEKIVNWLKYNQRDVSLLNDGELISELKPGVTYLFKFNYNYGFAKGNNKVLEAIADTSYEQALLLNNDTEVMPEFLVNLIDFNKVHPEYRVLTPVICYFNEKNKVWNAGGKQFLGFRKYFFADQSVENLKHKKKIDISFITGCALYFERSVLVYNKLFTERFFFGEEDFEFSMRMKREGVKMACVPASKVFHKVSSSTLHIHDLKKIYIYYLNRFINIKLSISAFSFFLWKYLYLFYINHLLRKKGFSRKEVCDFIRTLTKDSKHYNQVNQELFNEITGIKSI